MDSKSFCFNVVAFCCHVFLIVFLLRLRSCKSHTMKTACVNGTESGDCTGTCFKMRGVDKAPCDLVGFEHGYAVPSCESCMRVNNGTAPPPEALRVQQEGHGGDEAEAEAEAEEEEEEEEEDTVEKVEQQQQQQQLLRRADASTPDVSCGGFCCACECCNKAVNYGEGARCLGFILQNVCTTSNVRELRCCCVWLAFLVLKLPSTVCLVSAPPPIKQECDRACSAWNGAGSIKCVVPFPSNNFVWRVDDCGNCV